MRSVVRFLLDEHYPGWLAIQLTESDIDSAAVVLRDDLRGVDDTTVLRVATEEERIVVTEDVTTFSIAMTAAPAHAGVVFCHHRRFPRTRPGLARLGEEIVIARGNAPVARLVPNTVAGPRSMGFVAYCVPNVFFESLRRPNHVPVRRRLSAWATT